jgi:competence protein ComFB
MALIDSYDFEKLKNEAEHLVLSELGRQLENFSAPICLCHDCVLDMAAIALTSVKPLYKVSLLGGLYAAAAADDEAYATSIREAVTGAIEKVRNNPSHDIAKDPE